jgi:hypothetical protein
VEARKRLKDQELFYARLEGKHCALDELNGLDYAYPELIQRFRYSDKTLINFMRGYHEFMQDYSGDRTNSD